MLWTLAVAAAVIALLVTEQVALLYVLATLSVAALLAVVAWADLGGARRATQPPPFDDAAAIADGRTQATATANAAAAPRAGARRG